MGEILRRVPGAARSLAGTGEALAAVLAAGWRLRRRGPGKEMSLRSDEPEADAYADPDAGTPVGLTGGDRGPAAPARTPGDGVDEARRIARSLDRACRLLPWDPTCLVRALSLKRMLDRRGLTGARVRVGVRRSEGEFSAHAWLECCGQVVGDAPEQVAEYESLGGLDVVPE